MVKRPRKIWYEEENSIHLDRVRKIEKLRACGTLLKKEVRCNRLGKHPEQYFILK